MQPAREAPKVVVVKEIVRGRARPEAVAPVQLTPVEIAIEKAKRQLEIDAAKVKAMEAALQAAAQREVNERDRQVRAQAFVEEPVPFAPPPIARQNLLRPPIAPRRAIVQDDAPPVVLVAGLARNVMRAEPAAPPVRLDGRGRVIPNKPR